MKKWESELKGPTNADLDALYDEYDSQEPNAKRRLDALREANTQLTLLLKLLLKREDRLAGELSPSYPSFSSLSSQPPCMT